MPIISSFSNQFKPIGGNLVVVNNSILPPNNDFVYVLIPNDDLTYKLIPSNDFNYIEIPTNDLNYNLIPINDLNYVEIPNNDIIYITIPNSDIVYAFIPDNDLNPIEIPINDTTYVLIPNSDLTYTLIPNNDIQYNVLKPSTTFYDLIRWGEGMDVCDGGPQYPTLYVTGDGPTFCESTTFISNEFTNINGYIFAYYDGYVKTINVNGTNIGTERDVCQECPAAPVLKIVDLNINSLASYSGIGNTITDILGNTNASLFNSPTYGNDGCVSSITLNGTDQYIMTDSSISSHYDSSETSVFLWVYLADNGVILTEQGINTLNGGWHDSQIELVNGTLKFTVWNYIDIITSSVSTPLNNWYYIGFTYSGTTLTAYVNGQNAGTTSFARETPYQNGNGLYYAIGAADGTNLGDGSYSALKFGRLEIWDGAISSSDVLQNYYNSATTWICPTPTSTATPIPTETPTPTPSSSPTPTSTETPTPTPTPTPSSSPTPTPTPTPSSTSTPGVQFYLQTAPSSGTVWTDVSGNGKNATINGSYTYVSNNGGGIKLNNLDYNGTGYISVPYNINSNTVTVEIVASFNNTSHWATIWGNESYFANTGYFAFMSNANNLAWGTPPSSTTTAIITATNAIRHMVFVIDGTTKTLYINGVLHSTATLNNPATYANTEFLFGARHTNGGTGATDKLNNSNVANQPVFYQMRVYDKALTSGEVTTNFNDIKTTYGL